MPTIQVLPYVPSFGEKLVPALADAGSSIAQGLQQRQAQTALQKLFTPVRQAGVPVTPMDQLNQVGGAPAQTPIESILQNPSFGNILGVQQVLENAGIKGAGQILGQFAGNTQKELLKSQLRREEAQIPKLQELQKGIVESHESAEVSSANLKRLKQLNESGKLAGRLGAFLSEKTGIPVELWAGADTEEFNKLVAQRGMNVAQAYGFGRILQTEFQNFLKTIPSLLNSKEGRSRIINTLEYFDNISQERYKNFKELRGKYKNASDLELALAEKMEPQYKKFSDILNYGEELVEAESPSGEKGRIPRSQIQMAKKQNFKIIEK